MVWRSSNNAVATVDATGLVRGVSAGGVTVTATSEGKEGNAALEVESLPMQLQLSQDTVRFIGIAGILTPAPQNVQVTSTNGNVGGLVVEIAHTAGAAGWLTAVLAAPTAPSVAALTATTGVLFPGTYRARVTVRSTTQQDVAARAVEIEFTVQPGPQPNISASDRHNCAIDLAGQAFCWGYNGARQLGPGLTSNFETRPVLLPGGHRFLSVATGELHACGITIDARAYCWGTGFMGDGNSGTGLAPREVAGGHRWTQLAAGYRHTCGLTVQGEAYCWGYNGNAQLGDDSRTSRSTPTMVATIVRFTAISAGNAHTCAVATDGLAHCWGYRTAGGVGDGASTGYAQTPSAVAVVAAFRSITAANGHSCGVTTADETWCWGYNANGAVGDGSTTDRLQPVTIRVE